MAAINPHTPSPLPGGFSVFAGVGERTREGNDLYREMIESGERGHRGPHAGSPWVCGPAALKASALT